MAKSKALATSESKPTRTGPEPQGRAAPKVDLANQVLALGKQLRKLARADGDEQSFKQAEAWIASAGAMVRGAGDTPTGHDLPSQCFIDLTHHVEGERAAVLECELFLAAAVLRPISSDAIIRQHHEADALAHARSIEWCPSIADASAHGYVDDGELLKILYELALRGAKQSESPAARRARKSAGGEVLSPERRGEILKRLLGAEANSSDALVKSMRRAIEARVEAHQERAARPLERGDTEVPS
jgi:hypothetical protein